jgi:ribosomal protein L11 methyltransferase
MAWQQFVIDTATDELEELEQALLDCGALAVSLEDAGDAPVLEPAPGETPLWPRTRVKALFDAATSLSDVHAQLRRTLEHDPTGRIEPVPEQDWEQAWLANARPLRFGERLCVTPAALAQDDDEAVVVTLEPGLAFGTGSHPSTAACLAWLAEAEIDDARVLDYGCGSGLLAISALKLGARRATAVDIDPQARTASRLNAARNEVQNRLVVLAPGELAASGYDVVLANILARALIDLAPRLALLTREGGTIVLAGLLEDQAAEVSAIYGSKFTFAPPSVRDGWASLVGTRLRDRG